MGVASKIFARGTITEPPLNKSYIRHCVYTPPLGVCLTADTVFKLLKKTNKEWDWLANLILRISSSKRREIAQRYSTADDCLMEAIGLWMKRCPSASYRWIAFQLNLWNLGAFSLEMHLLLEPIQGRMSGW